MPLSPLLLLSLAGPGALVLEGAVPLLMFLLGGPEWPLLRVAAALLSLVSA